MPIPSSGSSPRLAYHHYQYLVYETLQGRISPNTTEFKRLVYHEE
jgi:hypothetical protein